MESLEQILQTKNSIPDKISMFCAHSVFYDLPETMHELYVQLVMNGANKDLAKWNDEDTALIKQISMQYATIDNKKGVLLWNLLLDKLIHLPLDLVAIQDEYDDIEDNIQQQEDVKDNNEQRDISHLP